MNKHVFLVTVTAETEEQAIEVMTERLYHDEDYGFGYSVDFEAGRAVAEWGFRHPGWPHAGIGPHVETQYTGQDGWHVGPYTEEDVHQHANGRPVVKRTRIVFPDVIGEWEDV